MTISGFQSYSFSAISLSMTVTRAASTPPGPAAIAPPADAAVDRVSLSPGATTAAEDADDASATETETSELPAAAPAPSVPPPSRAARRADALFTALDGDKDGAITEDEFKEGALNLLRNAGARRRIDDDGEGRETRGLRRLERKIERAFERVDKNDDGAIDKDELTAALSRGRGRRGGSDDAPPADAAPPEGQAAGAAGISISISVTYVSIAMQRYTSVQNTASADAPAAAPTPDALDAPERESETPALAA